MKCRKNVSWITLRFTTASTNAEALSEALTELGALSVSIDDAAAGTPDEQPIFGEPGMPEESLWASCAVSALFPADTNPNITADAASKAAGFKAVPSFTVEIIPESDWVRVTQAQFDPICISPRLWIVPTWHEPPESHAINIRLDPGVAFGTGSHPTTKLCLQWLEDHIRGDETVLDYGCGSGILAIVAKKLGAAHVIGIDIDSQAVEAARQNALANNAECEFRLPDEGTAVTAEITVANILSNPLKLLAPLLAKRTAADGRIVLSGILAPQATEVMAYYEPWFKMEVYKEDNGWVCLEGRKRLL
jgi:ribosomal protein L11 methyltransferase